MLRSARMMSVKLCRDVFDWVAIYLLRRLVVVSGPKFAGTPIAVVARGDLNGEISRRGGTGVIGNVGVRRMQSDRDQAAGGPGRCRGHHWTNRGHHDTDGRRAAGLRQPRSRGRAA